MKNKDLHPLIKAKGEKYTTDKGEWYRLYVYDNHFLVLSPNGKVYHYPDEAHPLKKGDKPHKINKGGIPGREEGDKI